MYNPYPNSPYSTLGNSRNQFSQSQQQQYDFSGWGDRLTSIEEGIKGLTESFKNINVPGEEFGEQSTAPEAEYAGNTAPPPLAAAPPVGGIPSIPVTPGAIDTGAEMIANVDPLAPTTPTAQPESLTDVQATPAGGLGGQQGPLFDPAPPGTVQLGAPGSTPTGTGLKPRKPRHFDWGMPMDWDRIHVPTITQELQQEYRKETGMGWSAGEEWEGKAKEMGFDFRKGQYLKDGEWTTAPMDWKGGKGTSRMNQLFEESGGVMGPRTKTVEGMKWGQGFTDWLGDKGYEVYTDPLPDYYGQQTGLGSLMGGGQQTFAEPHRTQYAMTAEEIKDPTGTKSARMDENARKRHESLNQSLIGRGIDPEEYWASRFTVSDYPLDPVRDAEQIASQQGETSYVHEPRRLAELSAAQQQGTRATDLRNTRETPGAVMTQADLLGAGTRPNDMMQPIGGPTRDQQYQQLALQAGALQGPTQKKIQGYMT